MGAPKETLGFQAEVKQLLQLMIHSLYSNKEIFLRELICNASDACDKLRFEALAQPALLEGDAELGIRVAFDKDARTITVSDNGIGMTRDEVIEHLGTIARSGTREFFARLTGDQQKDAQLIGQFGVGFYSSFIVADRVSVMTRRAGQPADSAVRWESDGGGEFTIEPAERAESGTDVTLHLREGEDELLDAARLRHIITRYSDHISLPIRMRANRSGTRRRAPTAPATNGDGQPGLRAVGAAEERDRRRAVPRLLQARLARLRRAARLDAQPRRGPQRVHPAALPARARALRPLGPRPAPRRQALRAARVHHGRRRAAAAALPALRARRDRLERPAAQRVARNPAGITRRAHDPRGLDQAGAGDARGPGRERRGEVRDLLEPVRRVFKEGAGEDAANRERIARLLRFASTANDGPEQNVSFADYIGRMKDKQAGIYYVTADSWDAARASPQLEIFRKKGIEVLLLGERVDEWMLSYLHEVEGKPLLSVAKGGLDLDALADETEKAEQEKTAAEAKDLIERLKAALGDRVKDVRPTFRLTDSPACLVADANDMSGHLQRLLKSAGQKLPGTETKPILELNPKHALIERLRDETDAARLADWGQLLLEQAQLAEGGQLADPAAFVKRLNRMLLGASE